MHLEPTPKAQNEQPGTLVRLNTIQNKEGNYKNHKLKMAFLRSLVTTRTTAIATAVPAAAFFTSSSSTSSSSDSSPNQSRFPSNSSGFGSISLASKDFHKQDKLGFVVKKKNLAATKMDAPSSDQRTATQVPPSIILYRKENFPFSCCVFVYGLIFLWFFFFLFSAEWRCITGASCKFDARLFYDWIVFVLVSVFASLCKILYMK